MRPLIPLAILLTACASSSHMAAQRATSRPTSGSSSDEPFVWKGTLRNGATLSIRNFNGAIDVKGASGDGAEVRAEKRSDRNGDLSFEVRKDGDDVTICSVWRGDSACDENRHHDRSFNDDDGHVSARITVTLPRGVRLDANTGNGNISVADAGGDVDVNTGNGSLHVEGTAQSVHANTGNGAVTVTDAHGRVKANTGNGRVNVTTSSGPVSVNTGHGDINVRLGLLPKDSDMEFRTGNGSVVVTVPPGIDADFDASTGNGSVTTDFDVHVRGSLNSHHIRGTIGRGGSSIRMTTGNGSVELRKSS